MVLFQTSGVNAYNNPVATTNARWMPYDEMGLCQQASPALRGAYLKLTTEMLNKQMQQLGIGVK
jgi:hypothetical protein